MLHGTKLTTLNVCRITTVNTHNTLTYSLCCTRYQLLFMAPTTFLNIFDLLYTHYAEQHSQCQHKIDNTTAYLVTHKR